MKNYFIFLKPFLFLGSIIGRIIFPSRHLSRKKKKILFFSSISTILILVPLISYSLSHLKGAEAAWFNSNWSFRKSIAITAHTSAETNVYINLNGANAIDTSDTIRFQADCGDLRFTDARGNILPYYVVSGCGTATTVVHVFFESFPAGAQTIYFYYGNPSAANGFNSSDFSTEASNYTIGSQGSEESGVAPIAYWKFDDGTGTQAKDSSQNGISGTLNNFDAAPSTRSGWMKDSDCITGKCLLFNGTSSYVSTADKDMFSPSVNSMTVSFWAKVPVSAAASGNGGCGAAGAYMVAKGNSSNWEWAFENDNNTLLCLDVFQLNGNGYNASDISVARTINDGQWHHYVATINPGVAVSLYIDGVLVKTVSSFSGSMGNGTQPVEIGRRGDGNYANAYIDDVKIYKYIRTANQIKADYDSRGGTNATVFGASDATKNLTNGLVGYWKMDETAWVNNCTTYNVADSSGNGNNGTPCPISTGPTGGAAGKFGNGGSFDGTNDYVTIQYSSSLYPSKLTASAWIYPTAVATSGNIISAGGNSGWRFRINTDRTITFFDRGSTNAITTTDVVSLSKWSHIAVVGDLSGLKIYINGNLSASNSVAYGGADAATYATIGAYNAGAVEVFTGTIDEARVYNRVLSPSEIQQLYNYTPGPVVYLNFEEGAGTSVKDKSGNNNSATWTGSSPYWGNGKFGKGGVCDGSTSYTNTSSGIYTLNGASVEMWVKVNGAGTNTYTITGSYGGSGNQRAPTIYVNSSNALLWEFGNLTTQSTGVTLEANKWYHVALTYDSSFNVNVYVNGIKVHSNTATTPGSFYSQVHFCHYGNFGTNFFKGQIDEVRMYNYPITAKQIVADMNSHPNSGAPVGYWKFNEGYGTKLNNSGNGGNTLYGTINGAVWSNDGKFGRGLVFDGSSSYVEINDNNALDTSAAWTVGGWFNPVDTVLSGSDTQLLIAKDETSTGRKINYQLGIGTNGKFGAAVSDSSCTVTGVTAIGSTVAQPGRWYYVMATFDGATGDLKIYVNGKLEATTATGYTAACANTGNVRLGQYDFAWTNYRDEFKGRMDEVKIFNYALSASEIKSDYNQGSNLILGALSDTSGVTGGSSASNSASAEFCVPGDTSTCSAPMGRWDFEETSGSTANDLSGSNVTGTANGTFIERGKVGRARNFNGTTDYIALTNTSSINSTGNKTVEAWIKTKGTNGMILGAYDVNSPFNGYGFGVRGADIGWNCGVGSNGSLSFIDSSLTWVCSTATVNDGAWHHVAAVNTGSAVRFYVDGKLSNSVTISFTPASYTGVKTIGAQAGGGNQWFNGNIDNLRVFNYARTPAQIAWDYNRGAPAGYWKMDECQGTRIYDSSGNNLHGTWSGTGGGTQTVAGTCASGSGAWGNGATGKFNSSLNFDGADDYVDIGTDAKLRPTTSLAVSAWVKRTGALANNAGIVSVGKNTSNVGGYVLLGTTSNTLRFYLDTNGSGSWVFAETNSALTLNQWYHIVGLWDGSTVKIYVNGVLQTTTGSASSIAYNSGKNDFIGLYGHTPNEKYFTGQLDDVRIYNYALTKQQIQQVMNQGSAIRFGPSTGNP